MRSSAAMVQGPRGNDQFNFGSFQLDPCRKVLWRDGQLLPLGPKVVHTLAVLVARCDEVVSKEELAREVWGDTVVEDNSLARNILLLRKALKEDPSGSFTIATIPRRGYRFCRAVESTQGQESQPDNSGLKIVAGSKTSINSRIQRHGLLVAVAVLLCLGIASIYFTGQAAVGRSHRRSVAVIGFANQSHQPDSAWLSPALSGMLVTELAAGGDLLTIAEETVARVRTELKLGDHDGFSAETLRRLHQDLNADVVISGAYTLLPSTGSTKDPRVRLDLRIQDAATGQTLTAVSEVGNQSTLFEMVARAGDRVRQELGTRAPTQEQARQAASSVSPTLRAVQQYAEGMQKLRNYDALGARELLQEAVRSDPNYAAAHSSLSEALSNLGYDRNSREEAKIAFELSGPLSREGQLSIEGRYRLATADWQGAEEAYRKLLASSPNNLDYGLQLADAQIKASKVQEALETLSALRKFPPPAGDDPRISLKEYEAWRGRGDFARMETALEAAADSAKRRGALLLIARARIRQCWVQQFLDQPRQALENCQEAHQIYSTVGERRGEAETLRLLGQLVSASDLSAANQYLEQALSIDRQIGSLVEQAGVMNLLATLQSSQGNHLGAKQFFEQVMTISEEAGDTLTAKETTNNLASELNALGLVSEARKLYQDALAAAETMGNDYLAAVVEYNNGSLQQSQGELDAAEQSYRRALSSFQRAGIKRYDISVNRSLGELAALRGKLPEAQKLYEGALSLGQGAPQKFETAEVEMDLDQLHLEQGQSSAAVETSLRRALETFRSASPTDLTTAVDNQAQAAALLARCLLSEDQPDAALQMINQAVALSRKATPEIRLTVATDAARVHFGVQKNRGATQALESLRRTIIEAHRFGYAGVELEARLALGEIQIYSGDSAAGRASVHAVGRDASNRGFLFLARKAGAS